MIIKRLIDEDLTNYKVPSMTIAFSSCTFKCGKEYCQNSPLAQSPNIDVSIPSIIKRYLDNPITSAVTCQGLEPFDSWEDLYSLVKEFRQYTQDDIVIFTGYEEQEILQQTLTLAEFPNIIIKFGRYIPNQQKHYDDILGVKLASDNQYALRIS